MVTTTDIFNYLLNQIGEMDDRITKIEIVKGSIGDKKGWNFKVFWNDRSYPNLVSGLYKTKKTAIKQLERYITTNQFDFYGDAE